MSPVITKKGKKEPEAQAPTQEMVDESVNTFKVVFLPPTSLKPYALNSKKHSRRQVTQLAKAIRTVGFDQPIVVDKNKVIIKGHGRRLAALELTLDLVPVVIRDDLTPEQVMAARLADNHVHTMSTLDVAKEQAEIKSYVQGGGADAGVFFDFMNVNKGDSLQVPGATSPTPKGTTSVAGKLLNCSKCGFTFLETKKS